MSTERHAEPELLRALDSVYEELRSEEAALLHMPSENDRLRARLERLQLGREQLRGALRHWKSGYAPELPEELELPFSVRPSLSSARRQRDVLSLVILGLLSLGPAMVIFGSQGTLCLFIVLTVISTVRLLRRWRKPLAWFFLEHGIEVWDTWKGKKPAAFVRYADMADAEVRVTPSQRRRGVGTLVVKYRSAQAKAALSMLLRDVPEPERLAKWLRAQRLDVPTGGW